MQIDHATIRSALFAIATLTALSGCSGKSLDVGTGNPGSNRNGSASTGTAGNPNATTLASSQKNAFMLTLHDARLYWITEDPNDSTTTAHVEACDTADCSNTVVEVAQFSGSVSSWTIRANTMYFVLYGEIVSCPITGCSQPTVIASPTASGLLAVDDANVYWLDQIQNAIFSCPLTGCSQPAESPASGITGTDLVADASQLYWIDENSFVGGTTIQAVPKDGSAPLRVIAEQQNKAANLAVQGGYLYWATTFSVGQLLRCPVAGCGRSESADGGADAGGSAPQVLLDHRFDPNQLWVDADGIVWAEDDPACGADCNHDEPQPARIFDCTLPDCSGSVRQVAGANINTMSVATARSFNSDGLVVADSSYVYFIDIDATDNASTDISTVRSIHRVPR